MPRAYGTSRPGGTTVFRSQSFRRIVALAALCALLAGCASEPTNRYTEPPPGTSLGPVLELLRFETEGDPVDVLIDAAGNAHVVVAAQDPKQVHHVTVSPQGVVRSETVASKASPSRVSAAFGDDDRLHLLLDDEHWVRDVSAWRAADPTPWAGSELQVRNPRFVRAPRGYLWAFEVPGKQVGAKGRWEWYGFGGGPAAIIFPWYSSSQKLVVVPGDGTTDPPWYVLDPQDNLDASNPLPIVDDHGTLHVVYTASREGLAAGHQARYARTSLVASAPATGEAKEADSLPHGKLTPVNGNPVPWLEQERVGLLQASAAVDPESGTLMIVRAHGTSLTCESGRWSPPGPLPLSTFWEPRLAPAGGDAFHMITTVDGRVLYLHYADGQWSVPVELGRADVASGSVWSAIQIASDASPRAFVVWPTETGMVGRWVEAPASTRAPTVARAEVRATGPASIPAHLRDFASGDAELVTPGVVSGFAEAWAAAEHVQLARNLHDTEQWESLATVVLEDDYGDDLRWYYLGRAAEGMSLCDAAERYYRVSEQRSASFWTRCLSLACSGFELPGALHARYAAVEAMRAAGQCAEQASQVPKSMQ